MFVLVAAAALVGMAFVPQRPLPPPGAAMRMSSAAVSLSSSTSSPPRPRPTSMSSAPPAASSERPPPAPLERLQGVRPDTTLAYAFATFIPTQLGLGSGRVVCDSLTFAVAASAALPRAHFYGVARALGACAFAVLSPLYGLLLDSDPFGRDRRAAANGTAAEGVRGRSSAVPIVSSPPKRWGSRLTTAFTLSSSEALVSVLHNASSSSSPSRQPMEQQQAAGRRRRPYEGERFLIVAMCAALGFSASVGLVFLYRFSPRPSRGGLLRDVWRVVRRPRIACQLGVVLVTGFLFGSQDSLLYFWYIQVRSLLASYSPLQHLLHNA